MKRVITLILVLVVLSVAAELTREQKRRCEQYNSIFENDSPQLDYGFVDNFQDGNGFTSGRSGFTTASGTAHQVVERYTERKPDNPLAKYLPELKRLADRHSSDVSRLQGYNIAWKRSSRDPLFRQIQDDVSDHLYYRPAMQAADKANVKSALGKCAFYDCIIQHGGGDDPDSLNAIIKRTQQTEGSSVLVKANEEKWIREFLRIRRNVLENPNNKNMLIEWRESVDRVDFLIDLIEDNNWDLNGPIHVLTPFHSDIIP